MPLPDFSDEEQIGTEVVHVFRTMGDWESGSLYSKLMNFLVTENTDWKDPNGRQVDYDVKKPFWQLMKTAPENLGICINRFVFFFS